MQVVTNSKNVESILFSKAQINEYLSGAITLIDLKKRLTRNNIELYSFNRGKGIIKAHLKINSKIEVIKF